MSGARHRPAAQRRRAPRFRSRWRRCCPAACTRRRRHRRPACTARRWYPPAATAASWPSPRAGGSSTAARNSTHWWPARCAMRRRVAAAQARARSRGRRAGHRARRTPAAGHGGRAGCSGSGSATTACCRRACSGSTGIRRQELGVTARYGLDLGGRRRAEQRSAAARVAVAQAERAAAELALGNAVVAATWPGRSTTRACSWRYSGWHRSTSEAQRVAARRSAELSRADEGLQLQQLRAAVLDQLGGYDTTMQLHRVAIAALVRQAPGSLPAFTAQALPAPAARAARRRDAGPDVPPARPDRGARPRRRCRSPTRTRRAPATCPTWTCAHCSGCPVATSSTCWRPAAGRRSSRPHCTCRCSTPAACAAAMPERRPELRATVADYNERLVQAPRRDQCRAGRTQAAAERAAPARAAGRDGCRAARTGAATRRRGTQRRAAAAGGHAPAGWRRRKRCCRRGSCSGDGTETDSRPGRRLWSRR